jgi:Glycosyltransferase
MNTRAEFHIIGAGEEEEACRSLAKQLDVEEKVFFHGWQNSKEKLKGFYDQADVFVMPSFRESFGTVYVEALSQGLPIIYTRGQGIDGYFDQGTVGYSCDPQNVDEIVTAIITIKDNYLSISSACSAGAQRFQWKVVAEEYNCVINDMRNR